MSQNNSCNNSCGAPSPLTSSNKSGCGVLPYDGMIHNIDNYNIYSSMSNKNGSGCGKHKYWNTCKVADQANVWGKCGDRGGVIHNDKDHPSCNSRSNVDSVTDQSMMNASDSGHAKVNGGAYKSLLGVDIAARGNDRGSNVRDYYTYGAYTSSGGFVDNNSVGPAKCSQPAPYYGYQKQTKDIYIPRAGPTKHCGDKTGYQFANGARKPSVNRSGKKSTCEGLYRNYEDHNEQYLNDHYAQYSSDNTAMPSQEVMDTYATDFTLLGDGRLDGTTNYASFGECVNPGVFDARDRANNAHINQNLGATPTGPRGRCHR
jgi:hypothetical protein